MFVVKVGGSVLNSFDGFRRLSGIASAKNQDKMLLVISALAKTTRELTECCFLAEKGHIAKSITHLNGIIRYHSDFSKSIISDGIILDKIKKALISDAEVLTALLRSIALTKELPLRIKDSIISHGEKFALLITSSFLSFSQVNHATVDSTEIIVTNDTFGNAIPLEKETLQNIGKKLLPFFNNFQLVLTQGFVAATKKKAITTMGIESSNLTAALYAKMLDAKELHIWSDVDGIRTADPRIADDTKLIRQMSYKQAYQYALAGLKLIHPQMIDFASSNNIPVIYKAAFSKKTISTKIIESATTQLPVIISKTGLSLQKLSRNNLTRQIENDESLFVDNDDAILISPRKKDVLDNRPVSQITIFNADYYKIITAINNLDEAGKNIHLISFAQTKTILIVVPVICQELVGILHKAIME
jgi:aspartate kinase